jgi:hypothetical protein
MNIPLSLPLLSFFFSFLTQVLKNFAPEEVLHVAGSGIDALGARSFGIFAALSWSQPEPGPQPCFVLKNITDLPAVFGL